MTSHAHANPGPHAAESLPERILCVLERDAQRIWPPQEIAEILDVDPRAVVIVLAGLSTDGFAERPSPGLYQANRHPAETTGRPSRPGACDTALAAAVTEMTYQLDSLVVALAALYDTVVDAGDVGTTTQLLVELAATVRDDRCRIDAARNRIGPDRLRAEAVAPSM